MSTNAERFGQIVRSRRIELDLNQVDVSALGGPSNSKLTDIENGRLKDLTRQTARKLDKGLRWEPGSARATWQGGTPRAIGSAPFEPDVEKVRREFAEAMRLARESGLSRDEWVRAFDDADAG